MVDGEVARREAPVVEEVPGESESETPNSPAYLRNVVFVGLYWAWMFLFYWSDALMVPAVLEANGEYILRGFGALGATVSLLVIFLQSRSKAHRPNVRIWHVGALVLMPDAAIYGALMLAGVPCVLPIAAVCWGLSGMGSGCMLMMIGLKFCTMGTKTAIPMAYQSIFLAVAYGVLTLLSGHDAVYVGIVILTPVFGFLLFRVDEDNRESVERVLARKNTIKKSPLRRDSNRLQVQMFVYSMVFSMTQYELLTVGNGEYGISFVWVCFFLSAVAFCVYGVYLNRIMSIGAFQISTLALVSAAILPLVTVNIPREVMLACCAIVAFGFTTYECISLYSLSRTVIVHDVSFERHFSMGRLANALGIFAGWTVAFLLHGAQGLLPVRPEMLVLISGIIITLVVAAVLFNIRNNVASMTLPVSSLSIPKPSQVNPLQPWVDACKELEEEYSLSPRESDVFRLMSRGRDAHYICDALCISSHTAKTHIYHIYQKTDVHSQQDLITMVEERVNRMLEESGHEEKQEGAPGV